MVRWSKKSSHDCGGSLGLDGRNDFILVMEDNNGFGERLHALHVSSSRPSRQSKQCEQQQQQQHQQQYVHEGSCLRRNRMPGENAPGFPRDYIILFQRYDATKLPGVSFFHHRRCIRYRYTMPWPKHRLGPLPVTCVCVCVF